MASQFRTARVWQSQATIQGNVQRAAYAIPPQDKHNDDLGGPYGQEHPNPAERKKVNRYEQGKKKKDKQYLPYVIFVVQRKTDLFFFPS